MGTSSLESGIMVKSVYLKFEIVFFNSSIEGDLAPLAKMSIFSSELLFFVICLLY